MTQRQSYLRCTPPRVHYCHFKYVTWVQHSGRTCGRAVSRRPQVHAVARLVTHKRHQHDGEITRPDSRERSAAACDEGYLQHTSTGCAAYARDEQRQNEERVRRHRRMNKQRVITMLSACRFALLTRHKHGHEPEYFIILNAHVYARGKKEYKNPIKW